MVYPGKGKEEFEIPKSRLVGGASLVQEPPLIGVTSVPLSYVRAANNVKRFCAEPICGIHPA
jgi:hypothetical protein